MTRQRSKPPSQRQRRVGEELRHVLAEVLARGDIRDPELKDVPITVTQVRPSPDLRNAMVYVTPLGGGEEKAVVAALQRAAPFLQAQVAREMTLRFVPRLRFAADESFREESRIDALLRGLHKEDDA